MIDNPEYHKYHACRSPSWRMDIVVDKLAQQPRPGRCSKHADTYTKTLRKFMLSFRNRSQEGREALHLDYPGLYMAYELETVHERNKQRHALQARMLAGQDNETIAQECSTLPTVVEWYEACFFNVRDRLNSRDWIVNQVIVPGYTRDTTATDEDVAAKMFGFFGGHIVLDFMLGLYNKRGIPKCAGEEDIGAFLDNNWATTIKAKSTMAAKTLEVNKYNVLELMATHSRIIEIEKQAESMGEIQNQTEKNIAAMLTQFPWAVGEETVGNYEENKLLLAYDNGAVELSDTQLLRAGAGFPDETLADKRLTKLPPPRKKEDKNEPS